MTRPLLDIANTYATPSFVFDEGAFAERMKATGEALGPKVALCYAIKANPFFIPAASRLGCKLEVCSPGELEICRTVGADPGLIIFSGVNKTADSVEAAVGYGVGVLTAESLKHAELIEAEGERRGRVLEVLLRLNAGSQFGMAREDLFWLVDHRADYPHLRIVGLHYFAGTQRMKIKHQERELEMLAALIDKLEAEHGFAIERLEYGPGLGVPQFTDDDFSDTLSPAREIAPALQRIAERVELTVEMGRFFAAECGTYLSAVNDLKVHDDISYCIIDGGINHISYVGQIMGMKSPIVSNESALERAGAQAGDSAGGADAAAYCICGSLCTTNDVIAREAHVPDLREGDVLAFHHIGAYAVTEGHALFLIRTMPRVIIKHADASLGLARDFTESYPLNSPAGG